MGKVFGPKAVPICTMPLFPISQPIYVSDTTVPIPTSLRTIQNYRTTRSSSKT
ncbi:hypothetical protein BaRGS_00024005, partial [Batillaria attramentaria]